MLDVVAIDDAVPGIRTLTLARPDREPLPSFTPGSHLVIEYDGGANAYSLTGETAAPREYVVSVLECLDGRGGSEMRLNFSGSSSDDIREGVRRIGAIVREQVELYGTLTGSVVPEPRSEPEPRTDLADVLELPRRRSDDGRRDAR